MTLPDLTPDRAPDIGPEEPRTPDTRRDSLVESGLVALVLVLAAVLGLPALLDSVRDQSVDLGAVFYPVLLVAFAGLAWSRRSGR